MQTAIEKVKSRVMSLMCLRLNEEDPQSSLAARLSKHPVTKSNARLRNPEPVCFRRRRLKRSRKRKDRRKQRRRRLLHIKKNQMQNACSATGNILKRAVWKSGCSAQNARSGPMKTAQCAGNDTRTYICDIIGHYVNKNPVLCTSECLLILFHFAPAHGANRNIFYFFCNSNHIYNMKYFYLQR